MRTKVASFGEKARSLTCGERFTKSDGSFAVVDNDKSVSIV